MGYKNLIDLFFKWDAGEPVTPLSKTYCFYRESKTCSVRGQQMLLFFTRDPGEPGTPPDGLPEKTLQSSETQRSRTCPSCQEGTVADLYEPKAVQKQSRDE